MINKKHVKSFNESTNNNEYNSIKEQKNHKIEEIDSKIVDASFSLKTFGTMTKSGAFINGAKWAIHNLTDDEIRYFRENTDKEDFSFIGF